MVLAVMLAKPGEYPLPNLLLHEVHQMAGANKASAVGSWQDTPQPQVEGTQRIASIRHEHQ